MSNAQCSHCCEKATCLTHIARCARPKSKERALLAKLREKYEGMPASSQTSAPILHPDAPPKTRRIAQQSGQTSLF
jgi:hypothetical protein